MSKTGQEMTQSNRIEPKVAHERDGFLFSCEKLAYWFFRLNGCLFLENFLVHHERKGREGTEIDMLSVRFPFRQELLLSGRAMPDHPVFRSAGKVDIILAESKKGLCSINSSWLDSKKQNMERILYIVGAISPKNIDGAARQIYEESFYGDETYRFRLFAIGEKTNDQLHKNVVQLEWSDILLFIHNRFLRYWKYKTQHRQWDSVGHMLFDMATGLMDKPDQFVNNVMTHLVD